AGTSFAVFNTATVRSRQARTRRRMMRTTFGSGVAALVFAAALAQPAAAADSIERKDFQVARDGATTVDRYTQFTIFDDVNAYVKDGVVTLRGRVTMPFKRDDIEKRVAKVDGVRSVKDAITVLPVSQFDDELRRRIARSIYGNSNFWNYAI